MSINVMPVIFQYDSTALSVASSTNCFEQICFANNLVNRIYSFFSSRNYVTCSSGCVFGPNFRLIFCIYNNNDDNDNIYNYD